ncbi:unnamed protein product, partial [Iphiclides podalirius]
MFSAILKWEVNNKFSCCGGTPMLAMSVLCTRVVIVSHCAVDWDQAKARQRRFAYAWLERRTNVARRVASVVLRNGT